ncbi:MAG TPA: tyrosine-type recombinase/integrase [Gemmatimonadales bacterium]|nr:tyrosine-type recombinase/integrase [Gemmatimonadales bacterium]
MDADAIEAIARAVAERLGPQRALEAPVGPKLGELYERWVTAHSRLASFACDDQRARRLLGLERFELRDEDGEKKLVTWSPDGGAILAERSISAVSGDDVDAFRAWFYVQTTRRKGEPSPATVNRYVMMLKRILNHNVKRGVIQRSPLMGYEDEEEDNARQVVLFEEDLDLLLTAFGDDDLMKAIVLLGYDSGMRLAELVCCRWRWLDERAGAVHVPGAIAKNGEPRKTDLSIRAAVACKKLPRPIKKDADFVFPNPATGEPYNKRWIHERFVRGVARAGLVGRDGTPPRLHDLRRSFITLMDMRGVPRAVGMEKSGHKSEAVYRRYRIVAPVEFRQAWLTMEAGRQAELAELAARRATASESVG